MKPGNAFFVLAILTTWGAATAHPLLAPHNPDAIVDLRSQESAAIVHAKWHYADAKVVQTALRAVGADMKPSGAPNLTHDIEPHAGGADFDDRGWEVIEASALETRRSTGRLSFGWYRTRITIPEKVGEFETRGSTVVLEVVVDDYAEVWIDGKLPQVLGQTGGPLTAGWNAPNRTVVARDVTPGQQYSVAIFTANAPLSNPPGNYVWIRSATLDFYRPGRWSTARAVPFTVERRDPAIDEMIPRDTVMEMVADGFDFAEGPVWVPAMFGGVGAQPIDEGYLLFSDPNRNVIYRMTADGRTSVYRTKSGYSGVDIASYRQPGSNGLALDAEGRLVICEHGNRRVTRIEHNGATTVLADRFEGNRLNSPNDLTFRSDGALYFTDPPFGLPKFHDDPARELAHFGVYCLKDNQLSLVSTDMTGPNGIAFSPDERHLYVANWDTARKVVMRYDVRSDGALEGGTVFFDMTGAPGEEALDGMEVDKRGNLYVSGPGGVWVIAPDARHLGMIKGPELPANFAWGGADSRTLYMAARAGIYRLRMNVGGNQG